MASTRITVRLPEDDLLLIRALVGTGEAPSVADFIRNAIGASLDDSAGWQRMLDEALAETGGPLTAEERAWADVALSRRHGPPGGTE